MQNALCNRYATALILGESVNRFLTTSTERRSGYAKKDLSFVAKTARVMQLTAIFLTVCCLSVTATTVSQSVTYSAKNVKLQEVFEVIKKQTGFFVFFNEKKINKANPVTIIAQQMPLADFMDQILENQPFSYSIQNTTITIKNKAESSAEHLSSPLISSLLSDPPITVRGRIINEKGEGVVASVIVKGTKEGVTSDNYGSFSIDNVDDKAILIISGVGIETLEVRVNGKNEINITAVTKIAAEEEVIINAGYYKTNDRSRTSSIVKINAKDIERQPVTNPLMALQGRVAGLTVTPTNGAAGIAPTIRIRGQNSLKTTAIGAIDGNLPLYVIDGIPIESRPLQSASMSLATVGFDPLAGINPYNIESIEILKDADATAIYGSRGANGVILITTKNGENSRKTDLDINIYKGAGQIVNRVDLMNSQQYFTMRKEALRNDGATPGLLDFDMTTWDTTQYTDWQDALLGNTSNVTDAEANISGGNANTSFRFGAGYHQETAIYSKDFGFKRFSGNLSLNHISSNGKFKANVSANYSFNKNSLYDNTSFITTVLTLSPNAPKLYNSDGSLNWEIIELFPGFFYNTWTNPLSFLLNTHNTNTGNLISNALVSYELLPGLTIKTSAGITDLNSNEVLKYPKAAASPSSQSFATGSATFTNTKRNSWIVEPQLNYAKHFREHTLNVVLGTTFQGSTSAYQAVQGTGYTSDALLNSLQAAPSKNIPSDISSDYRYTAIYGRIGYSYKEKYLLNLTGRRDGSSRFGPGNQFGNFGAIGAGWIFADPSSGNMPLQLSFGKIRTSYGITGSDQIGDYKFYDVYQIQPLPYGDNINLTPLSLFNSNLRWEKTKKWEAGIQLGFIKDRINLEINYYRNISSNQLESYPLPLMTGFPSVLINLPAKIQNTGWEFLLNTQNITTKYFSWKTSINITAPRNKLVAYADLENSTNALYYKVGEPLSLQRLYISKGVNPETGLFEFVDVNNDGNITDADRVLQKPTMAVFFGGVNNSFRFKNIELSFLLQFSRNPNMAFLQNAQIPGAKGNQFEYMMDRWQKVGDVAKYQRFNQDFSAYNNFYNSTLSDVNIADGSFVRVKTLSLTYTFHNNALQHIGIKNLSVYLQGQNLLTFTNYPGFDPETGIGLPPLRILSAGLQFKF